VGSHPPLSKFKLIMFLLTSRIASPLPLELGNLLPSTTRQLSAIELGRWPVQFGNRRQELGQFFDITASTKADLHFVGDCSTVHGMGTKLDSGTMFIEGPVGRRAGTQMTGGLITIHGEAGDWLGCEMAGGTLAVHGTAGKHAGASFVGSRHGMRGGVLHIHGDAGDEVGTRMRRGFIHVRGSVGAFAGSSMIAGTLIVSGAWGTSAGAGMKRGTLLALGTPPVLSPGFRYSCRISPGFLPLLKLPGTAKDWNCYRGDLLTGGRGELFTL
jgi:formylmethanofuran dehydrogenase subunit C